MSEVGYCSKCGHIGVVGEICSACRTRDGHDENCMFRLASTGAVPIECKHGYDVCPECDPCTCVSSIAQKPQKSLD